MFHRLTSFFRIAAAGLLASAAAAQTQTVAAPPIESFFKPPAMQTATVSPSGRWLAATTSGSAKRVVLSVVDLEGKEPTRQIRASAKDDIRWIQWVGDEWILFDIVDPDDRSVYGQGAGLMATNRDGSKSRMLIARDWDDTDIVLRRANKLSPAHAYLGRGAPGTAEIIVGEYNYDKNGSFSHVALKIVDLDGTKDTRTISDKAPQAMSWRFDSSGRPRVASRREGSNTVLFWADADGTWREIAKAPTLSMPFLPAYVDGDALYVRTFGAGGSNQLRRFDFETGKPASEMMLATPGFDGAIVPFRSQGSIVGLSMNLDTETQVWLTPQLKKFQAAVDAKLAGRVNTILSCSRCDGDAVVLVRSYGATDPGSFVLYRPQQDRWQLVGQRRPDIDPARMARLTFHRIQARDGEDLPVWVTHAARGTPPKPGPAVVLVHGGPWERGRAWEWSAEGEFLASRGYTVIEPEFRGSTGYGTNHEKAGWKQWGQAMQDDVTDALRFSVAQGWVDPSRVCIMGASYGGYATLMGLAKDPDQYRCGVAFAAVSDPRFMYEFHWNDIGRNAKTYSLPQMLGDPKTDEAMFIANSPVEQAARIKAPLLLAHGTLDRRVPIQNARRMRDALQKAGNKNFEYVIYDDEGHGFFYENNEFDYYRRVETFLAKHLKP